MKNSLQNTRGSRSSLTATCINIMARFVQVARHEEGIELHLQDSHILQKISGIAAHTNNRRLQMLHTRLLEELDKKTQATASKATNTAQVKRTQFADKFKGWTKALR